MMKHGVVAVVLVVMAGVGVFAQEKGKVRAPEVVSAEEWGSKPEAIPEARKHVPKFITIHHAGVVYKAGTDPAESVRKLQAWGQKEKKWPDLPYHFLIAPDGRIFAGRPVEYEPETNTTYKTRGHIGVELMGNFEVQRPSKAQVESLVKLTAWLATEFKIPVEAIGGHKDRAQTDCPGRDLYRYFKDGQFIGWVKGVMEGKEVKVELGTALKEGPVEEIPKK